MHFRPGRERGERDDDGADARGRQHADHERHTVGVEQPDMRALARAERDQATGQPCRETVGLCVADAFAVAHQQRMFASDPRLLAQKPGKRGTTGHARGRQRNSF